MIDGHRGQSTATGKDDAPVDEQLAAPPGAPVSASSEASLAGETSNSAAPALRNGFLIGKRLVRLGVSANQVTCLGVLLAAITGVCIGLGLFWIGIVLLTVGGLMDTLDGVVAKAAGTASKKGAFFDSVADRVADAFIFGGVAWYLASRPDPRLALIPFAILAVSAVISYERAKAESLGYDAKGGLMERAERLILLGVALLFHVILVPLLGLLLALSAFTALQRFVKVWRQASPELATASSTRSTWRRGRVESRWQAWREPRPAGRRPRATTQSRVRARRRDEPLGTRLRRVLATERQGMRRSAASAEHRSLVRADRRRHPRTDS
ncbi:MAG: CDP-alcohol phosphatidyltransferase family protein [Acidimicrobiales bacterium]|jgi:CDP-diacylglycerol--glycerol-3-phosphate 3-phosphatidyltransferase